MIDTINKNHYKQEVNKNCAQYYRTDEGHRAWVYKHRTLTCEFKTSTLIELSVNDYNNHDKDCRTPIKREEAL